MSIKVELLRKEFGNQVAVNDISFEVSSGNIVGFLGPNGAGKSTTMKMLTTYLLPTSGKAWICGIDVIKKPMEVKKHIGYLPESNPLYYDMYVKEYLEFVADIHQLGTNKKQRIDEMIVMTGLQKEIKKKIGKLSKGYKQRVGLAQAMIHNPDVLILDEPTSGLDPNQIVDIRDLILKIGQEKTVLLSTHIMQEVEAMCNKLIIIKNGNIVANDNIENVNSNTDNQYELINVTFSQTFDLKRLENLKNTISTTLVDTHTIQFQTTNSSELRKEILNWSLSNNIDIENLQINKSSLEDKFRELTQ